MGDGGNESVLYTAGIWGFLVLFGLALACWLLFRSMNNHLRGVSWSKEHRAEYDAERRARTLPVRRTPPPVDDAAADTTEPADGSRDRDAAPDQT